MNILIVTIKDWNIDNACKYKLENSYNNIEIITSKNDFNLDFINKFNPDIIFSHIGPG